MKRKAAWILVLHLLLLYHQTDARWGQFRSSTKSMKGTNIEDIIDQMHHHSNIDVSEDVSSKSCVAQFDEHDDTILRTKDSMNDGAVFMKAVNLVTADECRKQCCHTKENGRHCDLAVYQDNEIDDDSEFSRCFLFSCVDEDGVDSCKTASKEDYIVFRMKKKEIVAEELHNVAANFTRNPTQSVAKAEHPSSDCSGEFAVDNGFVIRPEESIANGASLLKESDIATSMVECQSQCCELKSRVPCDFAVFQKVKSDEKQQRCFLFSCTDKKGKFICSTAPNEEYSVSKRLKFSHQNEIETIINVNSTRGIPTSTSYISTTTQPAIETQKALTTKTTTTNVSPTPTSPIRTDLKKTASCRRLMWQCDNGDCVKVTDVCNGIPNCQDSSDEVGCDTLIDQKLTNPSTSAIVKASTSSESVISSSTTTTTISVMKSTTIGTVTPTPELPFLNPQKGNEAAGGRTEPQKGAVLPLALGLSVTVCVLIMVTCRFQLLKRKSRRRGKPLSMEESDYLINGMYL